MFFIHTYVQATCQRDPEVYATQHDPKIYPHTKFRIPTSNYIQICPELYLARTETRRRGQWHGNSWWPARAKDVSTCQIWNATINKIGDRLCVHFFKNWLLRSRSQWMKQWAHSMTPTYIHKLNLGVNMAYNMRHALTGLEQTWKSPWIWPCLGKIMEFEKKCLLSWNCPRIL